MNTEQKYRCIQVLKYSKDITIREFTNGEDRYFRAVIQGWRNFKFSSDNLKPKEALDRTIQLCKSFSESLSRDPKCIENLPSNIKFTA